ncbi:MAG: argininosuccinate lyase, partial [Pseudomonadota bacterium]
LQHGFPTATDLADWLVRKKGFAFRDAHHSTGRIVRLAEQKGCQLEALTLDELQEIEPAIDQTVYAVLSIEQALASRNSFGGTAPECVRAQATAWLDQLDSRQET